MKMKKMIKAAIKDEKEGVKDYSKMAKQSALHKKMFKGIAKDEKGHLKKLQKIKKK